VKRSRVEDGEEIVLSMLNEGQTFGGVALLDDRPHSAAAIAVTEVELVSFDREQFLQATATTPDLHKYLGAVNRVYAMSGGLVTLFEGEFRGQRAFVTVTRLDDGREVIVHHVIDRAIYSASVEIPAGVRCSDFVYRDDKRGILRVLTTYDRRLMGVHAEGPWEELSRVHNLLLERTPLPREALQQFSDSGYLWEPSPAQLLTHPQAMLCRCLRLTRTAVESAIAQGAVTLEDLSRETGATTVCGACTASIATLFSSAGQAVRLCKEIEVTRDVRSYRFKPGTQSVDGGETGPEAFRPALPGQHVVISAEIDGLWVQRPYTITSPAGCTEWREITVKREEHGFLSNWLFKRPQEPRLKLSHPKGDFWVNPTIGEPVVCLVAGIGMTPALAIARSVDEAQGDRRLHIDYSARTRVDLAYREELDELAARHDNISVQYRATGGRQHLDLAGVQAMHARWPGAQYLVCGPAGYMQAAQNMLLEVGVKPERIRLEVFTSVGHAPSETTPEPTAAKLLQLVVTMGLSAFYLLQGALDWDSIGMTALQQSNTYLMVTGALLMAFIGYQWYLPFLRLTNQSSPTAPRLHGQLGMLAPILLYLHSVSLGFAYTVVLSSLFIFNTMVGALDKTLIRRHAERQRFQRVWLLVHVPASFLVTGLTLIHLLYALAYK
jgi:ferredoxin-NADP reductase